MRTISKSILRSDAKCSGKPQPVKRVKRTYCRECNRRQRGNTWDLDYCRKRKGLCKDVRIGGNMTIIECKGFGEITGKPKYKLTTVPFEGMFKT